MAKLELYRKFTNYLAVSVLLSVAWIGYEVCFHFLYFLCLRSFLLLSNWHFNSYHWSTSSSYSVRMPKSLHYLLLSKVHNILLFYWRHLARGISTLHSIRPLRFSIFLSCCLNCTTYLTQKKKKNCTTYACLQYWRIKLLIFVCSVVFQCEWPVEWTVAKSLDHPSFLDFACVLAVSSDMCSLGSIS